MNLFDTDDLETRPARVSTATSAIDRALTAQLVVAWAGESGEEKRLGWWRSDFVSQFGGQDLFKRMLPATWEWAIFQGAREAARRKDAELRRQDHDPDRILSLFSLGFVLDEQIDERLQDLKRAGQPPHDALPGMVEGVLPNWNRNAFLEWVQRHGEVETVASPIGRRIKGDPPADLDQVVRRLVGALSPLTDSYPLPHFRKSA